jgi:hypothetical protein
LTSFDEVKTHGSALKRAVIERRMPSWGAARGFGAFKNDPSLSPQQIATIAAWVEAGAPPGTPVVRPPKPGASDAPEALVQGKPLRVQLPPFTGDMAAQDDAVRVTLGSRLIGAWHFTPGDPTVSQVEFFDGSGLTLWTWSPGSAGPHLFPKGTGVRIPDGALRVRTTRRTKDADGRFRPPKKRESLLLLWPVSEGMPLRWQAMKCGESASLNGTIYAIRPVHINSGAMEVVITEPARILGRFVRMTAPLVYWLREPATVASGSIRLEGDRCAAELVTTGRGRQKSNR